MLDRGVYLLLVLLIQQFSFAAAQLTWRQITPATNVKPQGRRDHAMGYDGVKNRVILFGGRGSQVFGDTWSFDLNNLTWSEMVSSPTAPEKRFSMVYGVSNGFFYISTGQEGSNLYNDIWRFNLQTDVWEKLNPAGEKPAIRYGSVGGFFSNSSRNFYLTHGFASDQRYANAFSYDTVDNKWAEVYPDKSSYAPNHPNARCIGGGAMVAEDQLVQYGGCASGGKTGGPCPAYDSWLFSASKESWTRLEDCASPRTYPSLALLPEVQGQKRVVLYGGSESNDAILKVDKAEDDQIGILDVNKEEWTLKKVSGTAPQKRAGASMIAHPEGAFMFGGSSRDDIWMLMGNSEDSDKTPKHTQSCKTAFSGTLNLIMLHGVFMILGWGILLQLGAFIARYLRNKDPLWFHLHRVCQVSGLLFAIAGFVCGIQSVRFGDWQFAHAVLGLVVMIIGLQQPFNALIRPHKVKGEEPSTLRKVWEAWHINSGRIALILAVVNISLGLLQGQAFNSQIAAWHWYVGIFVLAYVVMEARLWYNKCHKTQTSDIDLQMK